MSLPKHTLQELVVSWSKAVPEVMGTMLAEEVEWKVCKLKCHL